MRRLLILIYATAIVLFYFTYDYGNIQIVHKIAKDKAFDFLNSFIFANWETKTNSPNVMVFGMDNFYLKSQNMIDNKNITTYGYIFPNGKIADLVGKIDSYCKSLSKDNQPKALFIDYDFSFTSSIYGKTLSDEDKALIERLKKKRKYTILLPKTNRYNFIESFNDMELQKLIEDRKIRFVSVPLLESEDYITRRFQAYKSYPNSRTGKEHNYTIASLELWQLIYSEKNITKEFKPQDVIENRFIVKDYQKSIVEQNREYIHKNSNWERLSYYSANYPLNNIPNENFKNSLILIGANYSSLKNLFSTNANHKLSGVETIANILMTHFYFDGKLKKLDIYLGILLLLTVYIISYILSNVIPNKLRIVLVNSNISKVATITSIAIIFMALVSLIVLLEYQKWFDWSISIILFGISEVFMFRGKIIWKKLFLWLPRLLFYLLLLWL
jgi:CHASE2 domain-containing sensor protein